MSETPAKPAARAAAPPPAFASPSFLSPEPVASGAKQLSKHTLSGGRERKLKQLKRKLERAAVASTGDAVVTPLKLKTGKKLKLTPTPTLESAPSSKKSSSKAATNDAPIPRKPVRPPSNATSKHKKDAAAVLGDISNRPRQRLVASTAVPLSTPTRKLEFAPTPVKTQSGEAAPSKTKTQPAPPSSASSSSSSDESDDEGGYSSDECEVSFDAKTFGNVRVVREAQSSVVSIASTSSLSSTPPVGLEFQFAVASTVSSIAVAPNGQFLVVGFNNGTVYMYPLSKDALRFRRGVLLGHITSRGLYTQMMVRVAVPEDGRFIFAGVYRGSTEIRAFEVDSIKFPTDDPNESADNSKPYGDDDDDDSMDEEESGMFGVPTAKAISHTYSDAKLKGFGAVQSVVRPNSNSTEYHLLCGLGIKNLHLWRFFQQSSTEGSGAVEWNWECIFDKQTNGISLEYLSFHPTIPNRFYSKSEHQNIRVWDVVEERDGQDGMTIKKQSHTDIKQTVDAVAVFDDHAYGGGESLAVVDLRTASRMELDLPLSAKEQRAQQEVAKTSTRMAAYQRAYNPRSSRRRGAAAAEEMNNMRHMRTVAQVTGRDQAPFTVGMCSDGSVFIHQPQRDGMGLATPLEYIEGYEQFFRDPSLDFQAQFSDLTRVNTTGLLAVLPLPKSKNGDEWLIVAANQDQLLARSFKAFMHRSNQLKEYSSVKNGLRKVMRDLGQGAPSDDDSPSSTVDSDSAESGDEGDEEFVKQRKKSQQEAAKPSKTLPAKPTKVATSKPSRSAKSDASSASSKNEQKSRGRDKKPKVSSDVKAPQKSASSERKSGSDGIAAPKVKRAEKIPAPVTTPRRDTSKATGGDISQVPVTPTANAPSPVVSISSVSDSSNPNTPEQPSLSTRERQPRRLKELEWTPPNGSKQAVSESSASAAADKENSFAATVRDANAPTHSQSKHKKTKACTALFSNSDVAMASDDTAPAATDDSAVVVKSKPSKNTQSKEAKRPKADKSSNNPVNGGVVQPTDSSNMDADVAEDDDEVDAALEAVEAAEPVFVSVPLHSDGGLLFTASIFQYAGPNTACKPASKDTTDASAVDNVEALNEEAALLVRFARQNERLRMNFRIEKERIYKQLDCSCSSSTSSSGSSSSRRSGANWRKNLSADYARRKHLKRRQKKQLAARLQQLHADFAAQIGDLRAVQQLEANALRACQQLCELRTHLCPAPPAASEVHPPVRT